MRTRGIPAASGEPLSVFRTDEVLKRHPAYKLAKSGDPAAALELVGELAVPLIAQMGRFGSEMIFVAPHALEASGENAIPQTLAAYLARKSDARDDTSIVQRNKVYHTGADAMQRLVDDVSTMGGTLADLANYIQENGGRVAGSVLLVNAARSGEVIPASKSLELLERRFGNEIRATFGIEPAALTWEEAHYLIGFRTVDEFRNRATAAKQARVKRLRSKGIDVEEVSETLQSSADARRR